MSNFIPNYGGRSRIGGFSYNLPLFNNNNTDKEEKKKPEPPKLLTLTLGSVGDLLIEFNANVVFP